MDAGNWSSLAVSAVALVVGLLTYRNNRAGQNATSKIEDKKIELDGKRVTRDEFDSITRELRESLDDVKSDLQHEQEQRRLSNTYARTLAQVLRENGMPVPQPPAGLDLP